MIKPKLWDGGHLKGTWQVTLKLDGVRMLRDAKGNPVSRAGKPLYNLQEIAKYIVDAEVFKDNWEDSISLCRTHNGEPVKSYEVYSLDPLDPRLHICNITNPSASWILQKLEEVVKEGNEGLVLRQGSKWLKVKPHETFDVPITGYQEGKGRNRGRVGAIITPMGKVGSGLTDILRKELLETPLGTIIEVECMSLTSGKKFRHPRFIRIREDKLQENIKDVKE